MDYATFLNRIIEDGIAAAKKDYENDQQKRDGATKGFDECRGKTPEELVALWTEASKKVQDDLGEANDYWFWRCREAEIEWTCNVVSAMLVNQGKPALFSWQPTARGGMKAAEILGVSES
jgi:hypothetical protein